MKIGGDQMGMTPMQQMNSAPAAAPTPAPAPNYREADQIGRECISCQHYDGASRFCKLYNFQAKPHFTCDSFAAKGDAPGPEAPAPMPDGDTDDSYPMPA